MAEVSDSTRKEDQKYAAVDEQKEDYDRKTDDNSNSDSIETEHVHNDDSDKDSVNDDKDDKNNGDTTSHISEDVDEGSNGTNSNDDYNGGGEDTVKNQDKEYAKKSTVNALVIGLVIAVGAAAFFAGAYITDMDRQDQITQQNIDDAVAKLELKMLQQQLAEKQQVQQQQQSQPQQMVRISADDDPIIGDPNAPITIIEFSDFECPFCERFSAQTLPLIQEEYIDKGLVKLVYRDFPLQNIHPNAVITALAAECADDQGAFKGMHDILFASRSEWGKADSQSIVGVLVGYADAIEIDTDEFESCVVMGTHIDDIRKDIEDGRAYGITGTPGFYIGNDDIGYVQITGAQPFESFKRVIDAQLGL